MQPSHPPPPQQQQQQPSGAAAPSVPKRKRNVIQIIDPTTGQEINLNAGQENKTLTNDVEPAATTAAAAVAPASFDVSYHLRERCYL